MEEATPNSLTLHTLIMNAKKVLNRDHYQDRKVKLVNIVPMPHMKAIRVNAEVYGENLYLVSIIFYKINFSITRDADHPLAVRTVDQQLLYCNMINPNTSPVRVMCGCTWFRFACEYYLAKARTLLPSKKPRPYKKVVQSGRGSVNPQKLPCVCKHLYQVVLELQDRRIVKKEL